jgi:hypothetical protein
LIVGTYVHTYDAFSRAPYQSSIPPMRTPHDPVAGSCTPIYDALYSEYRRLFRALPGDRSGEEHFQYRPVQTVHSWPPHQDSRPATTVYGSGRHRDRSPAALPPGPSASGVVRDNRLRGL